MRLVETTLKTLTILHVVVALGAAPPATASQPGDIDSRTEKEQMQLLLMMLSAHEYSPRPKILARIGTAAEVTRLLIIIIGHKRYRPTVRLRALGTLYVYPTVDVRQYLLSVVYERANVGSQFGMLLRKQAIRSLGRGFGKAAVNDLAALRSDRNAQIREGVAHALGDTGAREALVPLKAWLPNEKELFVRVAIDRAIDSLRKRR